MNTDCPSYSYCSAFSHLLLVDGDALEGLLDDPTAVHLQGELLDVGAELEARRGGDSYFILLS